MEIRSYLMERREREISSLSNLILTERDRPSLSGATSSTEHGTDTGLLQEAGHARLEGRLARVLLGLVRVKG